jgi:hypothetical protein
VVHLLAPKNDCAHTVFDYDVTNGELEYINKDFENLLLEKMRKNIHLFCDPGDLDRLMGEELED